MDGESNKNPRTNKEEPATPALAKSLGQPWKEKLATAVNLGGICGKEPLWGNEWALSGCYLTYDLLPRQAPIGTPTPTTCGEGTWPLEVHKHPISLILRLGAGKRRGFPAPSNRRPIVAPPTERYLRLDVVVPGRKQPFSPSLSTTQRPRSNPRSRPA